MRMFGQLGLISCSESLDKYGPRTPKSSTVMSFSLQQFAFDVLKNENLAVSQNNNWCKYFLLPSS